MHPVGEESVEAGAFVHLVEMDDGFAVADRLWNVIPFLTSQS
jgi:hypothetical protein